LAVSGLLLASEPPTPKPVTNTDRLDFPKGGVLRVEGSIGELFVEGWDQPNMEITTVSSSENVHVKATRQGNEVVVTTALPHESMLPPHWPWADSNFDLEYHIKVPRDARLAVKHGVGEVYVDGLSGEIHATVRSGQITLRLPADGVYAIDARARLGDVESDFEGTERRGHLVFEHSLLHPASAPTQKLYLRTGFGDIVILKIRKPAPPAPLVQ
jgi:hypothetical protein